MKHFPKKLSDAVRRSIEQQALEKAREMGRRADDNDVNTVGHKLGRMNRGPVKKIWNMVQALWNAFRSPDTPVETKVTIIGGLIYLVSPLDIIPDSFMPAGLLDDAAVIAFIYAQCRDLITRMIPETAEQIRNGIKSAGDEACAQIDRITETALADTAGKQFASFCRRTLINSLLRLALFTVSMLLLYYSQPDWTADKYAASILLIIYTVWMLCSLIPGTAAAVKNACRVVPELHRIREREAQRAMQNRSKMKTQDMAAEAFYTSFVESAIPDDKKKLASFCRKIFGLWNEGRLPKWIPGKRDLAEHFWNAVKFRLFSFLAVFAGYLIVYNVVIKGLLMKSVLHFTMLQLLAYPFTYTWSVIVK